MSSNNNVFIYSTTQGSGDEADEHKHQNVMRKKSMSMEPKEIRKIKNIKLHRKTNSCTFSRRDVYGNLISKEFKQQKVTFRDMISLKPLTEVVPVKRIRYSDNRIENPIAKVEMAKCQCTCLIF